MEKQLTSASLKIKGSEGDGVHVVFYLILTGRTCAVTSHLPSSSPRTEVHIYTLTSPYTMSVRKHERPQFFSSDFFTTIVHNFPCHTSTCHC
jgi:hypothetical protein